MVDHTEAWQLRIAIGNRIAEGTMTVEHLRAFVALSREDLDKLFIPPVVNEVSSSSTDETVRVYGKGPSVIETN